MVYHLGDWGMGDSESRNRKYVEKSHDFLRPQQTLEDQQREVDLHPLSNQVNKRMLFLIFPFTASFLFVFLHFSFLYVVKVDDGFFPNNIRRLSLLIYFLLLYFVIIFFPSSHTFLSLPSFWFEKFSSYSYSLFRHLSGIFHPLCLRFLWSLFFSFFLSVMAFFYFLLYTFFSNLFLLVSLHK